MNLVPVELPWSDLLAVWALFFVWLGFFGLYIASIVWFVMRVGTQRGFTFRWLLAIAFLPILGFILFWASSRGSEG